MSGSLVAGSAAQGDRVPVAGSSSRAGAEALPAAGSGRGAGAGGVRPGAAGVGGQVAAGSSGATSAADSGGGGVVAGESAGSAETAGSAGTALDPGAAGGGGSSGEPVESAGTAADPSAAGGGGVTGDPGAAAGGGGEAGSAAGAGGDAAGSGGSPEAAGTGGAAGAPPPPPPVCSGPPGLYVGTTCADLAPGVEAFTPQFPLVTDDGLGNTALKERFVYLPAGAIIDTSNPDRWAFPVGTIFFKQFADPKTAKRVETRRLEKLAANAGYASWLVQTYAWSNDQLSVTLAPAAGVPNALGTGFDIPSTNQCKQCHQLVGTTNVDAPIGFNAIQLNHDLGALDLATLLLRGQLQNASNPTHPNVTLDNALVPGTAVQRPGLGYLHGNCGHCHGGPSPHGHQLLWTPVGTTTLSDSPLFSVSMTGVVCHCLDLWRGHSDGTTAYRYRINPSSGSSSGIVGRLSANAVTSPRDAMPPVGRKGSDPVGIAAVRAFIDSLEGFDCSTNAFACSP